MKNEIGVNSDRQECTVRRDTDHCAPKARSCDDASYRCAMKVLSAYHLWMSGHEAFPIFVDSLRQECRVAWIRRLYRNIKAVINDSNDDIWTPETELLPGFFHMDPRISSKLREMLLIRGEIPLLLE